MRKLLIGFIVVVVVAVPLYLRFHKKKPNLDTAYVGNREVTIWSTTAQVRSPLATANFGDRLAVVSRFNDQVQVRTASGVTGWVNDRELLTPEFWQKAQDLNSTTAGKPIEAHGRTRVLSNLHLDPGRDTPRIRQVNKNVVVDMYERRVLPVPAPNAQPKNADQESAPPPDSAAAPPESPAEAQSEAKKEDWWLVRAHLPDETQLSGWILGRFIDLEVPQPLPDYASATGMRIVAWFELNRVADSAGGTKPQYLVLGAKGSEGQPCDFTLMRVFTWGNARQRYETAFVESNLCGKLPLNLMPGKTSGADASFSFQDLSGGASGERLYKMHQTVVRRVRAPGAAGASSPSPRHLASRKHT
jgi:hypothetical protein